MTTSMHRLQISLPEDQVEYLREQTEKEGISIAEYIRRLIQQASEASAVQAAADSIWDIVGICEEHLPLIHNIPVSEQPDLYLAEAFMASHGTRKVSPKAP